MNNILLIIIIVILFILALGGIPYLLGKRAISRVIKIFQEYNALSIRNAKTIDELGLTPPTKLQSMFRRRDYKLQALDLLIRSDIIKVTEDNKLYLSEEKLLSSKLHKQ